MSKLQFSIGILSWKGYDSLKNSLISYEKNGLSQLTNNKFICLPEYNEEGIKIIKGREVTKIISNTNCLLYKSPRKRDRQKYRMQYYS